jgi:flagellar basal body rod protein FlgG
MQATLVGATFGKALAEKRFDVLVNNIANISTAGFKTVRVRFVIGTASTVPSIESATTSIDFSPGALVRTENPLDLAIEGDGFFVVSEKGSLRYTRNGQFKIDGEGRIVTANGSPVLGRGGEIRVRGASIEVEPDGSIFVDGVMVDRLRIADFAKKDALRYAGLSLFSAGDEREIEAKDYTIRQGYYEGSNVSMILELTNLINVLRVFETYTKISQMQEELNSKLTDSMRT